MANHASSRKASEYLEKPSGSIIFRREVSAYAGAETAFP
jgi:hypothetical protein